MKSIEININLDPVKDGAVCIAKPVTICEKVGVVVGTNGKFRVVTETEIKRIFEMLGENAGLEPMGKSGYAAIFRTDRIMKIEDEHYFVGSALVLKCKGDVLERMEPDMVEEAKDTFISRLRMLKNEEVQFSALQLD